MAAQEVIAADTTYAKFIYRLAWFWSLAAALYMFLASFANIPEGNEGNVNFTLGFLLGTVVATILGFFFGGVHKASQTPAASNNSSGLLVQSVSGVTATQVDATPPAAPTTQESAS